MVGEIRLRKAVSIMISICVIFSLVPVFRAAGNGTLINLPPTSVTMVVYDGTDSYFRTLLSNVPPGFDVADGEYLGWCADNRYIIARGVTHEVMLYCSCNPAGLPEDIKNEEWGMVNYIINHKNGAMMDIQEAMWYFINMVDGYTPSTPEAWSMVNDALENGTGFVPEPGNSVAIICYPQEETQISFVELYLPKSPVASFVYEPLEPKVGELVTFDATESIPGEDSIVSYEWDFDDGNTTATPDPVIAHVYGNSGTFNVTLTVTNTEGLSDKTWKLITVVSAIKHDITVVSVNASTPHEYPGRVVNITVVVKNNGEVSETFDVITYRDAIPIGTAHVNDLSVGENTTIVFSWDTTGLAPCHNWTISAEAPLIDDYNPSDNALIDGTVKIKMLGDVDANGIIDIYDVVAASVAYNSKPGDPTWNPQADIAPEYGWIDLFDLVTINCHYGETCP
jgi:PKD repeat protein